MLICFAGMARLKLLPGVLGNPLHAAKWPVLLLCNLVGRPDAEAASVVTRYGIRLLPELYAHLNPMPYEAAAQMEHDLADDLRRAGYTVTGGH